VRKMRNALPEIEESLLTIKQSHEAALPELRI
jgi:hypothetical protein